MQWANRDSRGYWTVSDTVQVHVRLSDSLKSEAEFSFSIEPLLGHGPRRQRVEISVEGIGSQTYDLSPISSINLAFKLEGKKLTRRDEVTFNIRVDSPTSPFALGISHDKRLLGIRLTNIAVTCPEREYRLLEIVLGGKPPEDFKFTHDSGQNLTVCFTSYGIEGKIIENFEFSGAVADLSGRKLFLRDNKRLWYHDGVNGYASSLFALHDKITNVCRSTSGRKLFVGTSMGGYAALLFGSLIGVDRVIAFSPQVRLDEASRSALGDTRWGKSVKQLNDKFDPVKLDILLKSINSPPRTTVFVSKNNPLDLAHIALLRRFSWIEIIVVDSDEHNAAAALKRQGNFQSIFFQE